MRSALATVDSGAAQIRRERSAHDFYREPRWSVDALLDAEPFEGLTLDPACGSGNIPLALMARRIFCVGADIVYRNFPGAIITDFLTSDFAAPRNIICNPPFADAEFFIKKALDLATHKVAMLLRLSFLEAGTGRTVKAKLRRWALEEAPLSRVLVFADRVSMPPGDFEGEAKGGAVAFAWLIWTQGHSGPATFGRLHRPAGV